MLNNSIELKQRIADVMAAVLIILSLDLFASGGGDAILAAGEITAPWLTAAIVGGLTLIATVTVLFGARIDRRCSEDYVWQLNANAALVAVMSTLLGFLLWDLSATRLEIVRAPDGADVTGIMMLSWAIAYIFYRVKGLIG